MHRHVTIAVAIALPMATSCGDLEDEANDPVADRSGELGAECVDPATAAFPVIPLPELPGLLALVPTFATNLQSLFTGPFTNWYQDELTTGVIKLAVMRGVVEQIALHDPHLPGARVGNADPELECPPETLAFRTIDGSCNRQEDPLMGAAGVRFGRNVPLQFGQSNPAALLSPNPREVSRKLLKRSSFKPIPSFNLLAAAWAQFQVHDWFNHELDPVGVIPVPLAADDPLRWTHDLEQMLVPTTLPDLTRLPEEAALPTTYVNEVTHWWDASQIYGSDLATANALRTFTGGHLLVEDDGLLPDEGGFSATGFRRNWWVGLTLLHTLFVHEHNAIADHLAAAYPGWDDERLYQTSRLVLAAEIARIHTLEWSVSVIPNPTVHAALNANWNGLNSYVVPPLPFDNGDPVLFGVPGSATDLHGVPYSITEEFVSVYRMHPFLPENLPVHELGSGQLLAHVPTATVRNAGASQAAEDFGIANLLFSFGTSKSGALVLDNYPAFLQALELPFGVLDLGTVDVLRDRERGVPRYNTLRQLVGLPPIPSFELLTGDAALAARLQEVYGSINNLDALIGMYAEGTRPSCFGFGETTFQIFTLMTTRRLQSDRFYTADYTPEVYTQEGLDWIDSATMKGVLLRHYPELAGALAGVDNPFFPWW